MQLFLALLLCVLVTASAFQRSFTRIHTSMMKMQAKEKLHETQIDGPAPYGQQFDQADVGTPSYATDFGAGDVSLELSVSISLCIKIYISS